MAARRKRGASRRKARGATTARAKPKKRAKRRPQQRAAKPRARRRERPRPVAADARPPAAAPAARAPEESPPALVAGVPVAVGVVTHFFPRARAALVALTGALSVGDTLHVRGATTDFVQRLASLQLDGAPVASAQAPAQVGVALAERAREGDAVYRVAF